jgi:hypothetical protein
VNIKVQQRTIASNFRLSSSPVLRRSTCCNSRQASLYASIAPSKFCALSRRTAVCAFCKAFESIVFLSCSLRSFCLAASEPSVSPGRLFSEVASWLRDVDNLLPDMAPSTSEVFSWPGLVFDALGDVPPRAGELDSAK